MQWEAYTLGRAPPTREPGAELTVAQEAAIAANVELARTAGSRYLVQRWAEGSYCEKIGRKREIEIQVRDPLLHRPPFNPAPCCDAAPHTRRAAASPLALASHFCARPFSPTETTSVHR